MRIGIMLRTIDEKQGIGIYTINLIEEILNLDRKNKYVLFYKTKEHLGRFAGHTNVKEALIKGGNKLIWDQVKIPLALRREQVDLLFHTKFTLPFLVHCKTVMSIHGASWFVHPELYGKMDVAYIKTVMPLYCRKADFIVSNSKVTTNDYLRLMPVTAGKIRTIHLGYNANFKVIEDPHILEAARKKYALPGKFILWVGKYDPRKNFDNLIKAYKLMRRDTDCRIALAGIGCEKYVEEYGLAEDVKNGYIKILGWVDHGDLPALYNLAWCMLFPSVYEEFGIPTCEAMACGCPPLVSNTGALPEIAGEAGILVKPFDPEDIAAKAREIWESHDLREKQRSLALKRAKAFNWRQCAEKTLSVFEEVGGG
ncbi:MAG: glycosyltransferase family 4 protein [Verrucomicrobiota bacterium]